MNIDVNLCTVSSVILLNCKKDSWNNLSDFYFMKHVFTFVLNWCPFRRSSQNCGSQVNGIRPCSLTKCGMVTDSSHPPSSKLE